MEKILEIKNLHVSFKRKRKPLLHIIRGVDLTLERGQIIGVVGESGSGKSVSTKALLNVNNSSITTFDSFLLGGQTYESVKSLKWRSVRGKHIAYISQNPMTSMNPSRKIKWHIYDVLEHKMKREKIQIDKKEETLNILRRFRITNPEMVLEFYPHELSGGMKQRIIIAMAILAGAEIIVADEPTTALDATVQSSVLNLLQEINKEFNISIIFISHNIAVVAKLCNYIYVMYAGRVVEKAAKKQLFTNPKHPYTWALIASIAEGKEKSDGKLYAIPGNPPDMANLPSGDPFAPRNTYAVAIDFKQEPPLFEVETNHWAATWTLHPMYPALQLPESVQSKIEEFKKTLNE